MLIVLTSRVTRVTRSPVLALSTLPSGSPSTVRHHVLTGLREQILSEERRHPQREEGQDRLHDDDTENCQLKAVQRGCRVPGADALSTSEPRMRGTTRPAMAANACNTSSAVIIARRVRKSRAAKAPTSRRSATGNPRSGFREAAKNSSARRWRSRWRCRHARNRDAGEPLLSGVNSSGSAGVGRSRTPGLCRAPGDRFADQPWGSSAGSSSARATVRR